MEDEFKEKDNSDMEYDMYIERFYMDMEDFFNENLGPVADKIDLMKKGVYSMMGNKIEKMAISWFLNRFGKDIQKRNEFTWDLVDSKRGGV
jgi:hypothetical protein